jgi:DNA-binding transcriptional LysR family regulator
VNLHRLEHFLAVVEHRSVSAAARAIHLAQPALSNQLHALERELGVELFHRTARGVTLTAAGAALVPEAQLLLERCRQTSARVKRISRGEEGRLAVGLVPTAANSELPVFLREFTLKFPQVDISLTEARPAELLRHLRAGSLDVAVHYQAADDPELACRLIATERLMLAVPSPHPLAKCTRVSVERVTGEPFILPAAHGSSGIHPRIVRLLREHSAEPDIVQTDIWLMQTIVGLVSAGIGLAIVPESASVIRNEAVKFVPLTDRGASVDLFAVHRAEHFEPPVARFLDLMAGPVAG